ncbi:MAG TPA: hypothetical protein VF008_13680 [Niastella sp.]
MNKKIVIPPSNTRAVAAFFEELNKKKEAIKKKLEMWSLEKGIGNVNTRTGK